MALNFSLGKKDKAETAAAPVPEKKKKSKAASRKTGFVMIVGDDGAILVFIQNGAIVRRLFAPSAEAEHIKPFLELLNANPKVPLRILCDMIDQSYVRHTLPPVSPLSVNKLVNRRLERDFAPEDIKGSLSLGREKAGRKEWNFMLISLANSDVLQQWLDPFLEAPNRFVGIFLVPVEAQQLMRQLAEKLSGGTEAKPSEWKILISHNKVGGFRQVVLRENQLIFTRLTQYSDNSPTQVMAGNIEQEVLNTIEYLRRLSYSEQSGLDVYGVMAQELKDALDTSKFGARRVNMLTPFEASQLFNLPQAALSGDRFGDVVLSANFLLNQKPALKLQPAYAKKLDQLYMAKLGLRGAAALAVCYCIYAGAMALFSWVDNGSQIEQSKSQKVAAQSALDDVQNRFNSIDEDQSAVMNIAALVRSIPGISDKPEAFVRDFALIKGQDVRVMNWSWNAVARAPSANNRNRGQANEETIAYNISIQVELTGHGGDRNQLIDQAQQFVQRMRESFAQYDVQTSPLPGEREEAEDLVIDFNAPVEDVTEILPGENQITITLTSPTENQEG